MSPPELSPRQARQRQLGGAVLIDIRDAHELATGTAEGSRCIGMATLQTDPAAHLASDRPVVLICQSGARSLRLARHLHQAGYGDVASVLGGLDQWQRDALPVRRPEGVDADFSERYARHLRLPEVGLAGQRRLQAARVLVLGAGGLGSPAAFYLAAAGVGELRLVDDDRVERSNLQRQILHAEAAVGQLKVESARQRLQALNPRIALDAVPERLTAANVDRLLADADVVIDGADNFAARYLLNDACVHLGKPLVYGAVHRFDGQLSVFDAGRARGVAPCYRCLFPEPPPPEAAPNCSQAGVLGVLPGVIGLLQATEAVKLILGIGEPLVGRLLRFDALAMRFSELRLTPDPDCTVCAPGRGRPGVVDVPAPACVAAPTAP